MKPVTTDDVIDLMDAYLTSAALNAALELGLFWLLAERPLDAAGVGEALGIPGNRSQPWLELLSYAGLLEPVAQGYAPSSTARTAILDAYSQESWAYLAKEARIRFPIIRDLAVHMRAPGSVWKAQGLTPPDYFAQLVASPEEARAFTRALYQVHLPYADEIANHLDMTGAQRLMDLGGGSGVVSLALLRRYPHLTAVVVDIPNVCAAGRELAQEISGADGVAERITYHAADYVQEDLDVQEDLPAGFDRVLLCDSGPYTEAMFKKIRTVLNPGGRLVLVNHFVPAEGLIPPSCLFWAFQGALANPDSAYTTTSEIQARLRRAGFEVLAERTLLPGDVWRWTSDWVLIEARKA
jgi:predicted O-methyltransferase YrrM